MNSSYHRRRSYAFEPKFLKGSCDPMIKQLLNLVISKSRAENIVICQCLADYLFAPKLISSPMTNYDILLDFVR